MKHEAAPAARRGRARPEDSFTPELVCHAYKLAIRRAARDAHRNECDRDAVECEACHGHARGIADAKWALNNATARD